METKKLTEKQIDALRRVIGGTDILALWLAKELREIEQIAPEYICITSRMGEYNAHDQLPYFGAIATKAGCEFLDKHPK